MPSILITRLRQGSRTMKWPAGPAPTLSDRYRGAPLLPVSCPASCKKACAAACPTGAIGKDRSVDLGRCLFCGDCAAACPSGAIAFSREWRQASRSRADLLRAPGQTELKLAEALDRKARSLFGHSLKLRVVSAGGCGACEADTNVLSTIGWDLGRFGISFVASPRHADGLLVTGPVTPNMSLALKKTWDAIPEPKIAIAVGACAISGGPYRDEASGQAGFEAHFPVDLYVPGCPPHPLTILHGLLRLLGKLEKEDV